MPQWDETRRRMAFGSFLGVVLGLAADSFLLADDPFWVSWMGPISFGILWPFGPLFLGALVGAGVGGMWRIPRPTSKLAWAAVLIGSAAIIVAPWVSRWQQLRGVRAELRVLSASLPSCPGATETVRRTGNSDWYQIGAYLAVTVEVAAEELQDFLRCYGAGLEEREFALRQCDKVACYERRNGRLEVDVDWSSDLTRAIVHVIVEVREDAGTGA